jgi:hypothetical protein
MKHRGVSFLEMLAMELKSEGKYVARGLSFRDAEFVHEQCALTEAQVCTHPPATMLDPAACMQSGLSMLQGAASQCSVEVLSLNHVVWAWTLIPED